MIMRVEDLILALQQFDPTAKVIGTWEGVTRELEVYAAADGRVMVDADNGMYRIRWQELKCEVCGKRAMNAPFKEKPVCYNHWKEFKDD
jgi:hypothetical protein